MKRVLVGRMIKAQTNPESDAVINFSAMEGHCSLYDSKDVLLMIEEKLKKLGIE